MKIWMSICIIGVVTAISCGIVSAGVFVWANVLHQFNWLYHLIFLSFFSFISISVIGALIFIAPWEREYKKKLDEGYGKRQSFELASNNIKWCPPKWLLQLFRKPEVV